MAQHKGLGGRGLEAFFSAPTPAEVITQVGAAQTGAVTTIPIEKIAVNRQQPRTEFDDAALQDLSRSIAKEGVLQPLLVTPLSDGRYELIAGERRLRASRLAGLAEVPVVIRTVEQDKMLELALVENIQRENLNPIEEALGYQALIEQFQLTQADTAERVGKSREHVANATRLLKLPKLIQEDISTGRMSVGHARALLALPTTQDQLNMRERVLKETLTVRDVEAMLQQRSGVSKKKNSNSNKKNLSPQMKLLLDNMQGKLGTKVRIQTAITEGRGQIIIEYFSLQDLDRIYRKITL